MKTMNKAVHRLLRLLAIFAAPWVASVGAQQYPSKPIKIIVPLGAGAGVDLAARLFGAMVSDSMGQPVVVENRPGGSSILGMIACAKAPPDGHTLCMTVADSLSFNPAFFSNLPYNAEKDFAPIILLATTNGALVANSKAPFNTYKEMIAYAKAKPGVLNWGTWGPATRPDLYRRWLNAKEGIDLLGIPYKGAAGSYPSVAAGETHATYMGQGAATPFIKAGKIKMLVTLAKTRSAFYPNISTLAESGPDPGLTAYIAAYAPAQTPKLIVDRLNSELAKAVRTKRGQEFLTENTWEAADNTSVEFAEFMRIDRENSIQVFRSLGIKPTAAPES
ncbi:MAG: tripartite tricarboxylate transporter substrate binding protein [Betaproteobacteria bacterium]|nr:tripartite tricarboxylate transporter substrate binding protein [Betaproteobacteria bacterium]